MTFPDRPALAVGSKVSGILRHLQQSMPLNTWIVFPVRTDLGSVVQMVGRVDHAVKTVTIDGFRLFECDMFRSLQTSPSDDFWGRDR